MSAPVPKLYALRIIKASTMHAEDIGGLGIAMLTALCVQWDDLNCAQPVCWANSRLAARSGLSRNSVGRVRSKLVELGWITYKQNGRNAGFYTPRMANVNAQNCAMQCAETVQSMGDHTPAVVPPNAQNCAMDGTTDSTTDGALYPPPLSSHSYPENQATNNLSEDDQEMFTADDEMQAANAQPYEVPERNSKDLLDMFGGRIDISQADRDEGISRLSVCQDLIDGCGWQGAYDILMAVVGSEWHNKIKKAIKDRAHAKQIAKDEDDLIHGPMREMLAQMQREDQDAQKEKA